MFIEAIEVYYLVLPLKFPYRTAYGEDSHIHSVVVRLISDGIEGWGEATPLYAPTYSPETATSAYFLNSEIFAPALVGRQLNFAKELLRILQIYKGNPLAKAAVESAWWMLKAEMENKPLHELLGGRFRNVEAGDSLGVQDSVDILIEKIQSSLDRGVKRMKLKIKHGWDKEMLSVVRSTFPELVLHVDCNSGYTLEDIDMFKSIDHLGLAMIEQPLHYRDLYEHAQLQKELDTPVCLDESVKSLRDLKLALEFGSCQMLNIKYGRVGGLSVAKQLHDLARQAGIECWVGGMLESAIGVGINIELATLSNFTYPGDLFASSRFYENEITDPPVIMNSDGTFSPSTVAGTPYRVVEEKLNRFVKAKVRIEA